MPSGEVPELKAGVVVIMGSRSDLDQAERVAAALGELGVSAEPRIASAHKTIHHLLQLMQEYEATYDRLVYVTIAGRANALSAVVDANTRFPVIAAPPSMPATSKAARTSRRALKKFPPASSAAPARSP